MYVQPMGMAKNKSKPSFKYKHTWNDEEQIKTLNICTKQYEW